ncbi:hypothetical protein P6709_10175 [Jeotgalibacillus sp. ET6]|uniref:hypothetical protein n=1 Tax=Jeotgalibacillus sp. ET6 TaxID=3037260 RepID=UPI00241849DF|nr:hypothetical protein [Jeotgalibacillus sp. ET6]MDG5472119.1 hypothetical protein [Jeotgalibacillus sp. ET6]
MSKFWFYFWIIVIAIIAIFTEEIATVMMLFLVLLSLNAIHATLENFYEDWKRRI